MTTPIPFGEAGLAPTRRVRRSTAPSGGSPPPPLPIQPHEVCCRAARLGVEAAR